jgi:hypothetical protein
VQRSAAADPGLVGPIVKGLLVGVGFGILAVLAVVILLMLG